MDVIKVVKTTGDFLYKCSGAKFADMRLFNSGTICPVVLYHSLSDTGSGKGLRKFENEIKYFSERYTVITCKEYYNSLNSKKISDPLIVTFDDGYSDNFEKALPILEKYGVKATFFISSGYISEEFEGAKMMSAEQIRILEEKGHEIGSHTHRHMNLRNHDYSEQFNDISMCINVLSSICRRRVTALAYPYGQYNNDTLKVMKELDINLGVTTASNNVINNDDLSEVPRIVMHNYESLKDVISRLEGSQNWLRFFQWYYSIKTHRNFD